MVIHVDLAWSDGDPSLSVVEEPEGLRVIADYRLSEAQVDQACAQLGPAGVGVSEAWRARVGLSERQPAR